jgi:hypothetical protein
VIQLCEEESKDFRKLLEDCFLTHVTRTYVHAAVDNMKWHFIL